MNEIEFFKELEKKYTEKCEFSFPEEFNKKLASECEKISDVVNLPDALLSEFNNTIGNKIQEIIDNYGVFRIITIDESDPENSVIEYTNTEFGKSVNDVFELIKLLSPDGYTFPYDKRDIIDLEFSLFDDINLNPLIKIVHKFKRFTWYIIPE